MGIPDPGQSHKNATSTGCFMVIQFQILTELNRRAIARAQGRTRAVSLVLRVTALSIVITGSFEGCGTDASVFCCIYISRDQPVSL
jgi:hypothetical protein